LAGKALGIFLAGPAMVWHGPNGRAARKGHRDGVNRPAPIDSTYIDPTYGEAPGALIHSTYGDAP
jgi:hypothetical protein